MPAGCWACDSPASQGLRRLPLEIVPGQRQILRSGDLEIVGVTFDHDRLQAGPLDRAGLIRDEKTGIQRASKVRSYNGLLVHGFGRLAAAMWLLA